MGLSQTKPIISSLTRRANAGCPFDLTDAIPRRVCLLLPLLGGAHPASPTLADHRLQGACPAQRQSLAPELTWRRTRSSALHAPSAGAISALTSALVRRRATCTPRPLN